MPPTKLLYLEDMTMLTADATVLDVQKENDKDVVVLDQTCFYPQGGGQPYDQGIIETADDRKLHVEEVRFIDGLVKHIGTFTGDGAFKINDRVTCHVESERRALHARLHSAGHIVDMAVTALGLNWIPGKGFHFPAGPYVEYATNTEVTDKEKLKSDLEQRGNEFIAEARPTSIIFMPKDQMHTVCHNVPDYIPEGKPARVVMYGDFGVPCGGTHVANLRDVGAITIRKIKGTSGILQVAYDIVR